MKEKNEYLDIEITKLEEKGFVRKDITYGTVRMDIISLLLTIPVILFMLWLYKRKGNFFDFGGFELSEILGAIMLFFLLEVVHKWIHGCSMAMFSRGKIQSISFVETKRAFVTRCICIEPLKLKHVIFALLAPMIILGIMPAIFAITLGSDFLFLISGVMILGSVSDVVYAYELLKYKTKEKTCIFYTHPYQYGYVVMSKDRGRTT